MLATVLTAPTSGSQARLAAQYLRMSTDHQRYSTEHQAAEIAAYAAARQIRVVKTYTDEGRSGLNINRRPGLARLIRDVVAGDAGFSIILVYDVSRWGRFQDIDESAHYEFLCHQAGVAVNYCAEAFENDGAVGSNLLKSIKRLMAGEYSRELSVRVSLAHRRLAAIGFWQGGEPGYGLRRMLVDASGKEKGILEAGCRKAFASDRVVLARGPEDELDVVRRIFRLYTRGSLVPTEIARCLNEDGIVAERGRRWTYDSVRTVLRSEKYLGRSTYGRFATKLRRYPANPAPPETWIRAELPFAAVITERTFAAAQAQNKRRGNARANYARRGKKAERLAPERMLEQLRELWAAQGYLNWALIDRTPEMPAAYSFVRKFGSLKEAYRRIGYGHPEGWRAVSWKRRDLARHPEAAESILGVLPGLCLEGPLRPDLFKLPNGVRILLALPKPAPSPRGDCWRFTVAAEPQVELLLVLRSDDQQNLVDCCILEMADFQARRFFQTYRRSRLAAFFQFPGLDCAAAWIIDWASTYDRTQLTDDPTHAGRKPTCHLAG